MQYDRDPESDAFSFDSLKDQLEKRWLELSESQSRHAGLQEKLQGSLREATQGKAQVMKEEQELLQHRASLDKQLAEVSKMEGKLDELVRKQLRLDETISSTRRKVQELENERRALQRQSAQSSLTSGRQSPLRGTVVNTVSPGRQDSYSRGRAQMLERMEGCRHCRRSCVIA